MKPMRFCESYYAEFVFSPGNALESNSHEIVPMSTDSLPSTSQEGNIKRPGIEQP